MDEVLVLEDLLDVEKFDYQTICDIVQEYHDIDTDREVDIDLVDDSFFMLWVLFGRMTEQLKEALEEIQELRSEGRNILQFRKDT